MSDPRTPILEVRDLATSIGPRGPDILCGVDLQIASGEVLGVVGESGSGKSMLALSVMGLLPRPVQVRSGSVRLQGRDLLTLPPVQLRTLRGKDMSMIFQEPMTSLNPVMRVGQQIGEVLRWHRGLEGAAARAEGIALLQRVEMPNPQRQIDAYPHELSGGMRQRVMIAIALAGQPRLLIADEPTTALDVTIQAQILELIRRIQRDDGMAVMLITHDLGVIAEMCDRVAVMYAGRIVEQGSALDVFDRPAHPYTRGLLASRPRISDGSQWLSTIEGTVPAVGQAGPGCSFAPRCPLATPACSQLPALRSVGPGHQAACIAATPALEPQP
ncbi:MAG: ABC transporter ATP-binding protein [Rhodoferax sp.]|nr:ABC transporter ATP-binding protein [Rhodoferax sp.]